MNVISYGEASPIAENKNRDGRAQNRRVALVVLQ
jgi:outer membrane protein OmpA-like peptidoglycan-associated protein